MLATWLGGRKQKEGADKLGISQQTLSKLLAGEEPALKTKLELRRKAGISLDAWPTPEVITEDDFATPPNAVNSSKGEA